MLLNHGLWDVEFRYIKPVLVILFILFFFAVEEAQKKDWAPLYYAGYLTAGTFLILAAVFISLQFFG